MSEVSASTAPQPSGLGFMLRALRHRNYRLFFAGQSVSLIGTWLTRVATSWLVYRLTGSALLLGARRLRRARSRRSCSRPFAGVLVDRWNRHRVLVVTQVLAMLQSARAGGASRSPATIDGLARRSR